MSWPRFQSTHPARGATYLVPLCRAGLEFQSTHPARGATTKEQQPKQSRKISIHAPREGCDLVPQRPTTSTCDFNPRTPRGVRPGRLIRDLCRKAISIHAPREGCDHRTNWTDGRRWYFNPRTPRGVRPVRSQNPNKGDLFQSTHPARGATVRPALVLNSETFQSTHPARGATHSCALKRVATNISIHAPREGCDRTDNSKSR